MKNLTKTAGPVSSILEAELRECVRRNGIVVWLDNDDIYSNFVDQLAALRSVGELPYDVVSFRGSYLRLMFQLETLAGGIGKPPLVVHLPRFNEERVKVTPVLELHMAGKRFRKRLDTLVTEAAAGKVRTEQIAEFKAQGLLSLENADAWLTMMIDGPKDNLSQHLHNMQLSAIVDDLLTSGFIASRVKSDNEIDQLWHVLETRTGITDQWHSATAGASASTSVSDITFSVASWALCVEYVTDLKRPPISKYLLQVNNLPTPVKDACKAFANHLRGRHVGFYQATADEAEQLLQDEIESARAEDLGNIDTFRFEEQKVLDAAITALENEHWELASEWADLRLNGGSFWLTQDLSRRSAWQLIDSAASLGKSILTAGLAFAANSDLDFAVEQYTEKGSVVDQKHRQLEQLRIALLYPQLPDFERLRTVLDQVRTYWRRWADAWAKNFNELCLSHGFLPSPSFQQRNLFDEVVRPMAKEGGVTAYFLVDAFRYEMAEELYQSMRDLSSATTIHLKARLAELPSNTEVGMNVLAPVVTNGKLRPVIANGRISGFSNGEFCVSNPESRKRAMQNRVGGGTCPWLSLDDVVNRESASLKKSVAQANLVVVHSQEIDNAGEKGVGPAVFERVMQKLRAAWRLLRDAGVKKFVFTADHGFLLLDGSTSTAQTHGRKIDPKRRHVFSSVAANHTGEVRVALKNLGYDDTTDHLMFPLTTAVFDTGNRSLSFVHGGNSLQERVIPVLTIIHRAEIGGDSLQYVIDASVCEAVAGMHCIGAKVSVSAQQALNFGSQREVELALRVPDTNAVDITVELCQTRGSARISSGSIMVMVGEPFEVFFRLTGSTDARVQVEIYPPSKAIQVQKCVLQNRFSVSGLTTATGASVPQSNYSGGDWLAQLPDDGIRQLFKHLSEHGAITESEAVSMLGSQRAFRSFSLKLEQYTAVVPFTVRIDVVSGVKRYVREGLG